MADVIPQEVEAEFERTLDDYEEQLLAKLRKVTSPIEKRLFDTRMALLAVATCLEKGD